MKKLRNETMEKIQIKPRLNHHDQLIVHLIPHTHIDAGWLKNMDEYYSGTNRLVQKDAGAVRDIFDTVIEELQVNLTRKFAIAEMGYFSMWYYKQDEKVKEAVKNLIHTGQLEFINGGWSANDEASPSYNDILNNMMIGHEFLKKEFDYTPKIGWNVDVFGHSDVATRLYSEMGFEAIFFSRLDYYEK